MLQCLVLAGGIGTRMRPQTEQVPKALIPVLDRPFCDWQLELLAANGIERVLYSVGYKGEMLRDHVGDGGRFGLEVKYVDEGEHLRGTGGAVRLAYDLGELEGAFFVLYGDSYLPIDYSAIEAAWEETSMPALMTVFRNEGQWDQSNAIYSDGQVVLYDKDRPANRVEEMRWIDYGLSVLSRNVIGDYCVPGAVADLADLTRELSREGKLAGYEVTQRFYEAGSPEGLADLERYLTEAG
jgi:NDP-sugar pyrophosphorylase family protein